MTACSAKPPKYRLERDGAFASQAQRSARARARLGSRLLTTLSATGTSTKLCGLTTLFSPQLLPNCSPP